MKFEFSDIIKHAQPLVYQAYRDRMVELSPYLDDVEKIVVLERDDSDPGRIRLLNEWTSGSKVPAFLQPIAKRFKVNQVTWLDHAEWVAAENLVNWRMEFPLLKEYVQASGHNVIVPENGQTRITVTGELILDFSSIRFMPRLVINSLVGQTEKFVLKMIKPNMLKINRGLEQFLNEHGAEIAAEAAKAKKPAGRKTKA